MPVYLANANFLKKKRAEWLEELKQAFQKGEGGNSLTQRLTQYTDELVHLAFRQAVENATGDSHTPIPSLTLVALGGFGRRQLCPYSDVDLMFLVRKRASGPIEKVIKATLHQLWDMGLEIGHAVRSPKDALTMAHQDITALTSMLEARFLIGDRHLFDVFQEALSLYILRKGKAGFLRDKIEERAERIKRFGNTVCLQEPHLKEGIGALRDLHHGLWIAQVLVGAREIETLNDSRIVNPSESVLLKEAVNYLHRLRFGLHFLCGKREDLLSFARQETLAKWIGFKDQENALAEVSMLRQYYRHALILRRFADSMTRIADGRLKKSLGIHRVLRDSSIQPESVKAPFILRHREIDFREYQPHPENRRDYFVEDPIRILDLIEPLLKKPIQWSRPLCQAMEASRNLIDEAFRSRPETKSRLIRIFQSSSGLARVLFTLRNTELLPRFFPELARMQFLVRHDFYHRYTVDEHSIRAILVLERISALKPRSELSNRISEEALAALWQPMEKPEILRLAILFHDAGKGYGKNHSERGEKLIRSVMDRLGFPEEDKETAQFLVRKHLLMSATVFSRDIDDFKTVREFTDQVGSLVRLEQLLLLTYVDIAAVAPAMMTPWKAGLLWQLYLRSRHLLLGEPDTIAQDMKDRREQILHILESHFPREIIIEQLEQLPDQYALSTTPGLVGRHLATLHQYDGKKAQVSLRFLALHEMEEAHQEKAYSETLEVIICTNDRLGLFRDIARSFHLENLHIISARLFTRKDGVVVDTVIAVNALPDSPVGPGRQATLCDRLGKVIRPGTSSASFKINPLPEQQELSSVDLGRTSFRTKLEFNNQASSDYSLIEIQAMDHPALLETVAACLTQKDLNIRFARLQRQGIRVVQAFFVTNREGSKVEDPDRMNDIRDFVLSYLDPTGVHPREESS